MKDDRKIKDVNSLKEYLNEIIKKFYYKINDFE